MNIQRVVDIAEALRGIMEWAGNVRAVVMASRASLEPVDKLRFLFHQASGLRPVLAYQNTDDARAVLEAIDDQAFVERFSFLPLSARMDCTVNVLTLVLSGERYVSGELMDMLMAWKSQKATEPDDGWTLTAREQEVLQHLAKGASNKVIARDLELAESTVKLHIHHIIGKLGVSNRTEAAVAYVIGLAKMQATP